MSAEDVRIWVHETGSLEAEAIDGAVAVLSADERAQYQRFHFARDARDYAAAHALLRHALSRDDTARPPIGSSTRHRWANRFCAIRSTRRRRSACRTRAAWSRAR